MTLQREHGEQVALIRWWAYEANARRVDHRLLFAIPNGGARHIAVAMKLKDEGVRAGTPDLLLCIPSNGYHGLFLEIKAPKTLGSKKGRISPAQTEMMDILQDQGYACFVSFGFDDARGQILSYLGAAR